jgi:hypothetical protein
MMAPGIAEAARLGAALCTVAGLFLLIDPTETKSILI